MHRLPAIDRDVLFSADRKGAQSARDLAPNGWPLVAVHTEAQPSFERVVQRPHVGPVVAITLLHAEGVEDAIAAGRDAEVASGIHQPIPHLSGPSRIDVELPAKLAHVGDALCKKVRVGDAKGLGGHEGKSAVRNVSDGDSLHHISCIGPPQSDDRELVRRLANPNLRGLTARLKSQPSQVAVHETRARDELESLLGQTRDGHVRDDSPIFLEQLRVYDASYGSIDEVARNPLQMRQRIWPSELDLSKRAHVDDADSLAKGAVLVGELVEVGRARESEAPLVGAGPTPRLPRLEVVGPFPSVLDPEHGAEVLHPRVQRTRPLRASPLVGVEGISKVVVVLVGLARELGRVTEVAMYRSEPPRPVGIEVEIGLGARDELGEAPSDTARAAETVEREAGGHIQAGHARHRPGQRVRVGRHRVRMADQFHDPRLVQEWETAGRAREEWLESRLVWRQRGSGVVPWHPVDPARHRVRLVPAEDDATGFCLAVDQVVRIAEARHIVRHLVTPHGEQCRVLMIDGRRHDEGARHRRDLRTPDASRHHHDLGLDRAGVCVDRLDCIGT